MFGKFQESALGVPEVRNKGWLGAGTEDCHIVMVRKLAKV